MRNDKTTTALRFLLLLLVCVALVISFLLLDRLIIHPDREDLASATEQRDKNRTVYLGGEAFLPRENQTNFLLIGVDVLGQMHSSGSYNNSAQSDFLTVISFDHTKKIYSILQINRDTMSGVDVLSLTGQKVGKSTMQLALAHTYGDGLARSCVNTVDAISYFLHGAKIDHYLCMTMSAIPILNDAAGGVELTLGPTQDLSEIHPLLTAGATVTLDGEMAMALVRARMDVGDGTNIARMERQQMYIRALLQTISQQKQSWNEAKLVEVYNLVKPYILQDGGISVLEDVLDWMSEYSFDGIYAPEGEAVEGKEYMEFYVDEPSLEALVATLYFDKKN